jgi:protein O-GlcNAc transferase
MANSDKPSRPASFGFNPVVTRKPASSGRSAIDQAFDLLEAENYQAASQAFLRIVAKQPNDCAARLGLCDALHRLGQREMVLFHAKQAAPLAQGNQDWVAHAGHLMIKAGASKEGFDFLESAAKANPSWAAVRGMLGSLYLHADRLGDAEKALNDALAIEPHMFETTLALASVLAAQGRADEAITLARQIAPNAPSDPNLLQMMAFAINSAEHAKPAEVFQTHVKLGQLYIQNASEAVRFGFPATDDPARSIRVAFVTHDFNNHSVSFFLESILKHLPRSDIHVLVYMTSTMTDEATKELAKLPHEYVHVPSITSVDLAKRVHQDNIDILIDLNGWTAGNRLHAFALRPSPVQMTYLGYPNTTGINTIDYRLVDSTTDPISSQAFATEQLIRIDPCFLCYCSVLHRPSVFKPDDKVPVRISDPDKPVTFGSFNNVTKITNTALRAWAKILQQVPGSRLVVKGRGLKQEEGRLAFKARAVEAGIAEDRLEILGQTSSISEHLAVYQSIDIALDTFPYNGTTTTCESLIMSTPVVALLGDRHVSRVSASILKGVALDNLVASSIDEYVHIAQSLGNDRARLSVLHEELRQRVDRSPLMDSKVFCDKFASILRQAWRVRCERGVGNAKGAVIHA